MLFHLIKITKTNQKRKKKLFYLFKKKRTTFIRAYPTGFAIVKARVSSPSDSLVMREVARSLSFKEENALRQSLAVVMAGQSKWKAKKQKQRSHKHLHVISQNSIAAC